MIEKEHKDVAENGKGPHVIAIALSGGSKSRHIVKWAIDKFGAEGPVTFRLIHVFHKITGVPTPMGNLIPLPQVRFDIAAAYKREIEWQKNEMILPYQQMFNFKKVSVEVVLLESDEIWTAISKEISKEGIKDLVIGASSHSMFARKIKGQSLSSMISETAPGCCTVYVVSKGKLEALRPSEGETHRSSIEYDSSAVDSTNSSSRYTTSTLDPGSNSSEYSFASSHVTTTSFDSGSTVNYGSNHRRNNTPESTSFEPDYGKDIDDSLSQGLRSAVSLQSISENTDSWFIDQVPSVIDEPSSSRSHSVSSVEEQKSINSELEKLKIELRHIRGMYSIAQNETQDATRKLSDLNRLRHEEAVKLKQIKEKEEMTKEIARLEKERFEAAKREAVYARECAQREAFQRREAEIKGARDAKEKEKLKTVLAGPMNQYQTFSWEEIVSATGSFNQKLKIGEGSYGSVYKCKLHHTPVAIKVLHSKEGAKSKQFLQELEILSKIRHPHLLLLLGACPEQGCLVYEYMENGSLEDRLLRRNDTPPIPWYDRFRIIWEVASALAFLHNNKPNSIIHRDLKPANILLDQNFVSKIGDTGLCTMLNLEPSAMSVMTLCTDSTPVGTLCYIDPEYQRTGKISVKADVYALGIVILQLLTAKPAVGITNVVEDAMKERRLMQILDKDGGKWPFRESAELALLGAQCAELRRKDRPDLQTKVLPILERIKDVAEKSRDAADGILVAPPSHFICPILVDVMEDPCVASDGYTYDRKAIELWIKDNDTSPTTNFPLSNKHLIPNYSLLYAITEWKSKRKFRTQKSTNH
ncbi:U-box domain-containing protein 35-like [Silene latifolia]|uniref:U-box domain-containing protein 35-like n=1 Tax=Silene latifolia TaxID=37657 RepID=UPI003D77D3A3